VSPVDQSETVATGVPPLQPSVRRSLRQSGAFLFRLLVTLSLIGFLISRIDFKRLPETISSIYWLPLIVAFGFGHVDRFLMALKWRLLIKSQALSVSVSDAIRTTYMGNFGGQFLPGGIGTDVVRVYLLRKLHLPTVSVAASILLERILGLYAHIVVALIALGVARLGVVSISDKLAWTIILLFLFYTIAFALSFAPWMERLLETCDKRFPNLPYLHKLLLGVRSYRLYRKNKSTLISFFFLSMLEVVVVTLVFYFAAEAMALKISLIQLLVSIPLTLILARLPVSISGIGVFEAIVALFFVQFGESINHAAIYGFLMRILEFFVLLPGAFLYLTEKSQIRYEGASEVPLSLAGDSNSLSNRAP
jgi:glycosyltransferase 2 family protein